MSPTAAPSWSRGAREHRAEVAEAAQSRIAPARGGRPHVADVDRAAVQDGPAAHEIPRDRHLLSDPAHGLGPAERQEPEPVAFYPVDVGVGRLAEARGGPHDGLENGGRVGGGSSGALHRRRVTHEGPAFGRSLRSRPVCARRHLSVSGIGPLGPG